MPADSDSPGTAVGSRPGDRLRAVLVLIGLGALGWVLLTQYTGPDRFESARRTTRAFFRAALARDSTHLRTLVSSDEPLHWALSAAARTPALIPNPDSAFEMRRVQRWDHSEQVAVWAAGVCSRQPFFITFVGEGRDRRIEALRTDCGREQVPDTTVQQ